MDGGVEDAADECVTSGGQCEFFLTCWLGGGLLDGACSGLLRGCCRRGPTASDKLAIGTQPAPYEHQPKAITIIDKDKDNSKFMISMQE